MAADRCAGRNRKGPRNEQPRSAHAGHRRRTRLCLLRVLWAVELRLRWEPALGTAAPSLAEYLRCGRFTDYRRRLACAQPSRERRVLAWRQSPRRQDCLEDRPLEV